MREVLETFIKGSRQRKLNICFHKIRIEVIKHDLSEVIFYAQLCNTYV